MRKSPHPLPWLDADEPFPPVETAWAEGDPAPGLLAAGRSLDVATLRQAYALGIFPWFGVGQPILWWSPDPRMVLRTDNFKLHRSLPPPRQNSCRLHRTKNPGAAMKDKNWHDTDKHSRTGR